MKKRNRWKLMGVGIVIVCGLAPARGWADDRETAGNLFDAGAEAYDAGQYLVAAEAFLKAHALLKSPALQFSAAQAYRRQYLVDASPDALRRAVRLYREYLREDAAGERREDAMKALADLVPIEARLRRKSIATVAPTPATNTPATNATGKPGSDKPTPIPIPVPGSQPPAAPPAPDMLEEEPEEPETAAPRKTRVLISAKPTAAEVSVDGAAFVRVPAVVEVKAGPHKVHAKADGYFDDDFQIDAVESELVARHVVLRPKPGRLMVNGAGGASLSLDGQIRAVLPLEHPLDLDPGEHFLTVTRSGRTSFTKTISIERDRNLTIDAYSFMTNQRVGAWSTFTVGLLGAAATGILGGLTWQQNGIASNLESQRQTLAMSSAQITEFNNALRLRDAYSTAALTTGGVSALVLLTGAGLFLFDAPATIPIPSKKTDSTNPPARLEMTVGLASAGLRVTF